LTTFSEVIYARRKLGINTITLVVGRRGIGKSYISMALSEHFDNNFSVDNVVFEVDNFLEVINKLPMQSCVVFDEVGIAVGSRTFMSQINLIMSYVGESFRHTGIDLFVTVPNPYLVDINIRQLSDMMVRVSARGKGRVYAIKADIFKSGHIQTPVLCDLQVRKPSDALCASYEVKRTAYLNGQYAKWSEMIKDNKKRERPTKNIKVEALEIINRMKNEGIPKTKFAYALVDELDISLSKAYQLLHTAKDNEDLE
jgi:hypothetical protein